MEWVTQNAGEAVRMGPFLFIQGNGETAFKSGCGFHVPYRSGAGSSKPADAAASQLRERPAPSHREQSQPAVWNRSLPGHSIRMPDEGGSLQRRRVIPSAVGKVGGYSHEPSWPLDSGDQRQGDDASGEVEAAY